MNQPMLLLRGKREVTPENLGEALQQAIEIEIATIPVYLYTYYSINRVPDQDAIKAVVVKGLLAQGKTQQEAVTVATDLSADIMVYANKAGALIMSVVVEEMLHMALSSNVKQALAGMPELVGKMPAIWPAYLPGHEPPFPINRAKLTLDQLITFLKIESPKPLPKLKGSASPFPYTTIGEFYDMIKKCIVSNDLKYNTKAAQLVPGKGYYTHNTIDTVYYDKEHKPKFTNAEDSGDLIHVTDKKSAARAIDEIVEQGEGHVGATGLNPDGTPVCGTPDSKDYDDPSKKELSHFEKFAQIYCQYEALNKSFNDLNIGKINISDFFVLDFATNPVTADYPIVAQKVSTLINAITTYIYVMTEACYRQAGHTQFEIFMFGIHKSMIFILNSLCGDIVKLKYVDKDGVQRPVAPTFENYRFSAASSPKTQLIALYNDAVGSYSAINYLGQRFHDLPDVPLEPYQNTVHGSMFS